MRHAPSCPYCTVVNVVCFWGPMRERPWKRPVLFVASAILAAGFGAALVYTWSKYPRWGLRVMLMSLVVVGAFGVLVALRGCDACVARLLGSV